MRLLARESPGASSAHCRRALPAVWRVHSGNGALGRRSAQAQVLAQTEPLCARRQAPMRDGAVRRALPAHPSRCTCLACAQRVRRRRAPGDHRSEDLHHPPPSVEDVSKKEELVAIALRFRRADPPESRRPTRFEGPNRHAHVGRSHAARRARPARPPLHRGTARGTGGARGGL